jgi:hypothetical protein
MKYADWDDSPDPDHPGIYWLKWTSRYGSLRSHATFDGEVTLCKKQAIPPFVVMRDGDRCPSCLKAIERLYP